MKILDKEVKARMVGAKPAPWDKKNFNHWVIQVDEQYFDYWDSPAHQKRMHTLDYHRQFILSAYECLISDALAYFAYRDDLQGFVEDFGYSINTAEETLQGCRSTYNKLNMNDDELLKAYEYLQELEEQS